MALCIRNLGALCGALFRTKASQHDPETSRKPRRCVVFYFLRQQAELLERLLREQRRDAALMEDLSGRGPAGHGRRETRRARC